MFDTCRSCAEEKNAHEVSSAETVKILVIIKLDFVSTNIATGGFFTLKSGWTKSVQMLEML